MRKNPTAKSLFLLLAFMAGFIPPIPGIGSAEAQVRGNQQGSVQRSDRGSRPQVNRGHVNRGNVNRSHANRGHVNRGHVNRGHVNRGHVNRGHVYRGHRGGTVVRHHRPARVVVVHPRRHWNRGGAIAAGAAVGFIAGAAAVSWAGQPPRPGYCWFYTTPSRTTGFWDWCPIR